MTVWCRNQREFFRHRQPLTVTGNGASAPFVVPEAYHTNGVPPITYRANAPRPYICSIPLDAWLTLPSSSVLSSPPLHRTNLVLSPVASFVLCGLTFIMPSLPSHLSKVGPRRLRLPHAPVRAKPVARTPTNEASIASTSKPRDRPSFPCVEAHATRESRLRSSRQSSNLATSSPSTSRFLLPASEPEPPYERPNPKSYKVYHHTNRFPSLMHRPCLNLTSHMKLGARYRPQKTTLSCCTLACQRRRMLPPPTSIHRKAGGRSSSAQVVHLTPISSSSYAPTS